MNNKALIKWEASTQEIAEVRKYGSYEFYLNNEYDIKVVIRYGNKLVLMQNDYDENIWGSFTGTIQDWMEWYHAFLHDSFNKKDTTYFKAKFMSSTKVKFRSCHTFCVIFSCDPCTKYVEYFILLIDLWY